MSYILICDDHPIVGRGLVELLQSIPGVDLCIYKAAALDCLAHVEESTTPLLAVVDFWLNGKVSRELVLELKKIGIRVLVISADDDPLIMAKSRDWGADGFISKQESPSRIREAVFSLINGGSWFACATSVDTINELRPRNLLPLSAREIGLTSRQGQILSIILEGHPNKVIAQKLFVSEATVKEHISGIFQRTSTKNRMELVTLFKHRKIEWN
jgi:DNA-binding NarL/FixJ family response regulator